MISVNNLSKSYNSKIALDKISFEIKPGEICGYIGTNGAGKTTTVKILNGSLRFDSGKIVIGETDISKMPEHKRAKYIGRVFQDPMLGTAAGMMIEENLAIAARRGKTPGFSWAIKEEERQAFREMLRELDLGLEDRLTARVGLLSGGQRQALTLLMATMQQPKLLLLDEHTAALDPKTADKVLKLTRSIISRHHLTTLMITHNMRDALRFGNCLIMMNAGRIVVDVEGMEKDRLTIPDLLALFERAAGAALDNDRILLG